MMRLKKKNPNLKILISVKDENDGINFSNMAKTEDSRKVFAQSCLNVMDTYYFDGKMLALIGFN